jgi:tetratricopeptide (TPR) repeat protein
MLGESYYLVRQYEQARPCFLYASRYLEGADKVTADYRLACTLYRVGDGNGALERIKGFLTAHPNDARVGKLLAYQMLILTPRGKEMEKEIEGIHQKIKSNLAKYDYSTGMEADEILSDFYRKTQQPDKAQALFAGIVNNFRQVAAEYERENRPVPDMLKRSVDNAALQLGVLAMERKNSVEAVKWFENIRYDLDLKQKSRLLLGKMAYEQGDYRRVAQYLGEPGFLDAVPAGPVRSDMFLLLGLAEKKLPDANAGRVEEYLRQVTPGGRGYATAQSALGEIYFQKSLYQTAAPYFRNLLDYPDQADTGLYYLGVIHLELGLRETDAAKAKPLFTQASDFFNQLFTKYPLSPRIKQAQERIPRLTERGYEVTFARSDEETLKGLQATAQNQKGQLAGAQALLSIARLQLKTLTNEQTGKVVKAANYADAAAACDQLLDAGVYKGQGWSESDWKAIRCEALYMRGKCELSSLNPPAAKPGEPASRYVPGANGTRAVGWLTEASKLVDSKNLDMVRNVEISLLEALFKSDRKEDKELAEKRYGELENNYGSDPQLQRLSVELADWYADQKRFADAGRMLAGVASRGKDLPQDELVKIHYTSGAMFSRAGTEASKLAAEAGFWIRIGPKATVALGDDDLLKTYAPLQKTITVKPPPSGNNMTRLEALLAVSQAAKVPFTWATAKGDGSMDALLSVKMADGHKKGQVLTGEPATVATLLQQILPPEVHMEFSIGLTDGTPTVPPPKDKDDPDAVGYRVIQIWNTQRPDLYYRPLAASLGSFQQLSGGKPMLFYSLLQKIEGVSQARVVWAEGIDRQEKLAREFRELPGIRADQPVTALQALNAATESLGLQWSIVQRNVTAEHFEAAKDEFNKVRQIDPKSKYGERALLSVALNYYHVQDYAKMKVILREYLKVFDNVDNEQRQLAAYWIGWVFEKENNLRDASNYYARAAEERLIIYKLPADKKPLTREELKKSLSYESQAALLETCAGEFVEKPLSELLEFVTLNAHLELRTDASAQSVNANVNRPAFKNVPIFDVLCDALDQLGLSFRVENVNPEFAEKAYFRMVVVNRKDNAMPQALEAAQTLLTRCPQTTRRRDVYAMMIDIYKGLKDYRNVVATMEQLKAITTDEAEKQRLANELAWIYFDVADYPKALDAFQICLASAKSPQERLDLRDGYARSAFRLKKYNEALAAYEQLIKEEDRPLRKFIHELMAYIVKVETGKAEDRDLPAAAAKHLADYEQLTEALRSRLAPEDVAKATWVYYALSKRDLKNGAPDEAVKKLNACANSTDDMLAAEALYELGAVRMLQKQFSEARDALEELLFRGKGSDAIVRGTFALASCYQELGRTEKAREKIRQLEERYPLSPLVEEAKKNPLYVSKDKPDETK